MIQTTLSELTREDMKWCVSTLPRTVRDLLKQESCKAIIAGGYIRDRIAGQKPSDIDLFAPDAAHAEAWANRLANSADVRLIKTQNAFTVLTSPTVQFVHRWTYTEPQDVVASFDFTIAMGAIWYDASRVTDGKPATGWQSATHERFYIDLAAKRLVYTSPVRNEDAGGSLLRVLKFYQRGYRIPLDSMGSVIARLIKGVEPDVLARGSEYFIGRVVTGLLREVDPNIDPEHFAHMSAVNESTDSESEAVDSEAF